MKHSPQLSLHETLSFICINQLSACFNGKINTNSCNSMNNLHIHNRNLPAFFVCEIFLKVYLVDQLSNWVVGFSNKALDKPCTSHWTSQGSVPFFFIFILTGTICEGELKCSVKLSINEQLQAPKALRMRKKVSMVLLSATKYCYLHSFVVLLCIRAGKQMYLFMSIK